MKERLIGLVLLVVGAVLGYFCVYEPLEAAGRQAAEVSLEMKGAILFPLAVGMGLAYLILGSAATAVFGTREKPSVLAYVSAIVLVLLGVGLYFWLQFTLEAQGYQFH
jgi:hypothetical protein